MGTLAGSPFKPKSAPESSDNPNLCIGGLLPSSATWRLDWLQQCAEKAALERRLERMRTEYTYQGLLEATVRQQIVDECALSLKELKKTFSDPKSAGR